MASDDDSEESGSKSGISPVDQLKSYLAYARRALGAHRVGAASTFGVLASLAIVAAIVWPRSYTCTTVLAAQDNTVLGGEKAVDVLRGSAEVIANHENLAAIVDELGLAKTWETTLPPAQRFKQTVMAKIRGPLKESDKRDALIALLEARVSVTPPGWMQTKLIVSVDWHEPKIAAQLADALDQSFLRARHVTEISSISEYIAILEGHAKELRTEIQDLSGQAQRERDDKFAQAQAQVPAVAATPAPRAPVAAAPRPAAPAASSAPPEDLSALKAKIAEQEQAVRGMEAERQRRLADAESTLNDLRSKYTPAHPLVVAAETRIATLASDSAQLLALRSEVASLNATLKAKSAPKDAGSLGGARPPGSGVASSTPGASSVEPLPAEIMRLMQDDGEDLDPAVAAQFRTAVAKYATLRDKIGTARVDLDTAQAAFKHRYQIVVPAEVPATPSKPKVPMIVIMGLLGALLAALLVAVAAELRTGRLVAVWQVHQLGIPVLGDMRWPPSTER